MVMWSSSEVQANMMGFDYLSEGEIARLLQQRVLLAPQTTQCTVPVEVTAGSQGGSLMMNAFGPEANFSYPVRPARAPRNWAPEWTVKLRTRASYMGMLGMDMEAMMRGETGQAAAAATAPAQPAGPDFGAIGATIAVLPAKPGPMSRRGAGNRWQVHHRHFFGYHGWSRRTPG